MVLIILFLILAFAFAGGPKAKANLIDRQGNAVGEVLIYSVPAGGVLLKVNARLPPGVHAFHIHSMGSCKTPDFKSAKGHFNPYGKKHGLMNPEGHHAGDLPNVYVGRDGMLRIEIHAPYVTLEKEKPNSLFKKGGTAIVIHEGADDYRSDPAGKAGKRIACGVVEEIR